MRIGQITNKIFIICIIKMTRIWLITVIIIIVIWGIQKINMSNNSNKYLKYQYENWNEAKIQKFHQIDHPRLNKIITKYVNYYKNKITGSTTWIQNNFISELNIYMKKDCLYDNWNITINIDEILEYLLQNHKTTWAKLKVIYTEKWNDMNDNDKKHYLSKIFNINMDNVINDITITKIGNTIAEDMKNYCYIEILKELRPYIYETIKFIEQIIQKYAYIVIAGGESINQMLDFKDRRPTTDIDTKIILKHNQDECENYATSYKDECVKFVNYFWYDVYPEVLHFLDKKYESMYKDLQHVSDLPEMKLYGLAFINPELENQAPFLKRFTRMSAQQEVILITVDMRIKQMLSYDKNFIYSEGNYAGFLDSPVIYNPYETEHLYHNITLAKPKDFFTNLRNNGIYEQDFYYISPKYAINDTERFVRTQERKAKIEKDINRFNLLMKKFGSEEHKPFYKPKIKDLTTIPMYKYSNKMFPKTKPLEILSNCISTPYQSKIREWKNEHEKVYCEPLNKILFKIISYDNVKEHLSYFAQIMINDNIYPNFLLPMSNVEEVIEFLSTFYFQPKKVSKLSHRNLNIFKMQNDKYVCKSVSDEICFDECSKNNKNGCSVFAFKDKKRLSNVSIDTTSEWCVNNWIPFLLNVYYNIIREIYETKNHFMKKILLIDLISDYFEYDTSLSNQDIIDYHLLHLTGIYKHIGIEQVDNIINMLLELKKCL